jgi:uncharacterized membrane protein YhaH (DUF805 family)
VAEVTTTSQAASPLPRPGRRWSLQDRVCVAAALLGAVVSALAATTVTLPVESDLGLVASLPLAYWAGLAVINVALAVTLFSGRADRPNGWLMAWLLATLVFVMFGVAALVTDDPRGEVSWRHVGIADTLQRTGEINPEVDAYFNWPGFFALLALVSKTTGVSALEIALWAPVVTVGLWLLALALVVRALSDDPRRLWLALWVFCLGNWQDQDYLSPQAFGFFLHLCVLALLLGALRANTPKLEGVAPARLLRWWRGRTPGEPDARRRVAALLVCILLVVVVTGSHQLTPFMLLMAIGVLTVSGRSWAPGLLLLTLVVVGVWLAYPASSYLLGHPPLADIGLDQAATANVAERVAGSSGHLLIVRLRMALAAALWLLAAAGALADRRRGRRDIRPVLLMAAPFVLLPAQSYGGEMLIRVSLFALPFTAYLAAGALLPRRWPPRARVVRVVGLGLLCSALAGLMVTGRYGNAGFDMFTEDEIVAAQKMYELAPDGATVIAAAHPTPWSNREYVERNHRTIKDLCRTATGPHACAVLIHEYALHHRGGALVLMNRASQASLVMTGVLAPGSFEQYERGLRELPGTTLVYENPDARIYRIGAP